MSPNKYKIGNECIKESLIEKLANLSSNTDGKNKLEMKQLISELNAIALEWKSSRNMSECKCGTTFDAFNNKVNLYNLRFFEMLKLLVNMAFYEF